MNTSDARSQINADITEINTEAAREKISGNQLTGTGAITDANKADKTVTTNNVENEKETKVTLTKIASVLIMHNNARKIPSEEEITS